MAFKVELDDATVVDLQAQARSIVLQDKQRDWALTQGRAVDSPVWGVFGDGMENPHTVRLRMTLHKDLTRAQSRVVIDSIDQALLRTVKLINTADGTELDVAAARITNEQPLHQSYALELTFYPGVAPVPVVPVDSQGQPIGGVFVNRRRILPKTAEATVTVQTVIDFVALAGMEVKEGYIANMGAADFTFTLTHGTDVASPVTLQSRSSHEISYPLTGVTITPGAGAEAWYQVVVR